MAASYNNADLPFGLTVNRVRSSLLCRSELQNDFLVEAAEVEFGADLFRLD